MVYHGLKLRLLFCQSTFFAFLMAVPYEKPIETLEDVVQRTDRAHFCGGENDESNKKLS